MLVCGDFIYTLEIIERILREVVNRDRLCGTNVKASGFPQFLGLSDPLQKYRHNLSLFGLLDGVVMQRWGEGGDRCCIDSVLKTPEPSKETCKRF